MRLIVEYAITQCVEFVVDDDITKSEAEMLADEYLSEHAEEICEDICLGHEPVELNNVWRGDRKEWES